jgi:hypothetical protein
MFWGRARRCGPGAIVFDGRHQRFGGRLDGALGFDARKAWYPSGQHPARVNSICSMRASWALLDLQLNQIRVTATLEC